MMMDFAQTMFMAEAEGFLPTREGKIQGIIKAVKAYPGSTIELHDFFRIVDKWGIDIHSLTQAELARIESAIK